MIKENMTVEVIDEEKHVKAKVPISELIDFIYQAVASRKSEQKEKVKHDK